MIAKNVINPINDQISLRSCYCYIKKYLYIIRCKNKKNEEIKCLYFIISSFIYCSAYITNYWNNHTMNLDTSYNKKHGFDWC